MKLKLAHAPHGQTEMICQTEKGGTQVLKAGESIDVTPAEGQDFLARWPGCFEVGGVEGKDKHDHKEAVAADGKGKGYAHKDAKAKD